MNNLSIPNIWTEKYRPKTLDEILLSDDIKNYFLKIKEKKAELQNLIFYGTAGCGKSSLANIIVKDVLNCEYILINASEENGIDVIRNKILNFIQTKSFNESYKVVILEEAESLSYSSSGGRTGSQNALKQMMEEYLSNARFIFTTNNISGLIEPIISRCIGFNITLTFEQCLKRCIEILRSEKIKVSINDKEKIINLVKKYVPDLRKILNTLQYLSLSGELKFDNTCEYDIFLKELFNKIHNEKNLFNIRNFVIQNEKLFKYDYYNLIRNLFNLFYDWVTSLNYEENEVKIKKISLIFAESLKDSQYVIDKEINFFATIIKLKDVL